MTLAISWIRTIGSSEELICLTDSRLRSCGHWDCGPKLFPTPRGDSAILFAGSTLYAYPIVHHINACISQHRKLHSRGLDLPELRGHITRVLNAAIGENVSLEGEDNPGVEFIFTGFDWRTHKYLSWLFHFDKSIERFTFRPTRRWRGGNEKKALTVIGNYQDEYKKRLVSLLTEREKLQSGGFDMEPFEVLRDMIRENNHTHIGGAPQILKIYKHINTKPMAVLWPDSKSGRVSLGGRTLLDYEAHDYETLDPDSPNTN